MRPLTSFFDASPLLNLLGVSSALFAFGITQVLFGGWWYPIFYLPGLILLALALVLFSLNALLHPYNYSKGLYLGGLVCVLTYLIVCVYLFYSNSNALDVFMGYQNNLLLIGATLAYFFARAALKCKAGGSILIFLVLSPVLLQFVLVSYQYAASAQLHPMRSLALWFNFLEPSVLVGTFGTRGTYSAVLVTAMLYSLSYSLWGKSSPALKSLLFIFAAFCAFLLIASLSRAGYLALFGGLSSFVVLSFYLILKYSVLNRFVLSSAFTIFFLTSLALAYFLYDRSILVQIRVSGLFDDPYRVQLWAALFPKVYTLNPLWGVGAGSFDSLSLRYGPASYSSRHLYAHNDWLQILFEYGAVGMGLFSLMVLTHLLVGLISIFKMAKDLYCMSVIPQHPKLALAIGAFSGSVALTTHAFFDYPLQVMSSLFLCALSLGILSALPSPVLSPLLTPSSFHKLKNILPSVAILFSVWVISYCVPLLKPEYKSLLAENELCAGNYRQAWEQLQEGVDAIPSYREHPRLQLLEAEIACRLGNQASDPQERMFWYERSTQAWLKVLMLRPHFAYAYREAALTLDWMGKHQDALPLHLRGMALDPQSGLGYEYFGLHYWLRKQYPEAIRLLEYGSMLPGSRLSKQYLPLVISDFHKSAGQ